MPVGTQPLFAYPSSLPPFRGRSRSSTGLSTSTVPRRPAASTSTPASPHPTQDEHAFSDDEHYDPTYGLRPEGLPNKSVFTTFRGLFSPNKGLADLAEERSDVDELDEEESRSFDISGWDDLIPDGSFSAPSVSEAEDVQEYETVPAVGGGTITRPRVLHSHSQVLSPSGQSMSRATSRPSSRPTSISRTPSLQSALDATPIPHPTFQRAFSAVSMSDRPHSWNGQYNPYFAGTTPLWNEPSGEDSSMLHSHSHLNHGYPFTSSPPMHDVPQIREPVPRRMGSPSSIRTHNSVSTDVTGSVPTPPGPITDDEEGIQINRTRRSSFSSFNSLDRFGSPPDRLSISEHESKIVLKPGLSSVSKLSTLSYSNHTLSPYVQTLEHFTVRSVPPRGTSSGSGSGSAVDRHPTKAKRKRTFFLGGKPNSRTQGSRSADISQPVSPAPALSEFDASDMDRYFRSRDDAAPPYSDAHSHSPPLIRKRLRPQH